MADSLRAAPPVSTRDSGDYKPISALAVTALVVTILTALVLIAFGIAAMVTRRPFMHWSIALMAVVAVGLSIAAKMQAARSQGTRAGGSLATAALLISLIFGLGYAAYAFAIDFSVRKQSQEIADRFLQQLFDHQTERAFMLTKEPPIQRTMPDDPDAIRRRFGSTDLSQFNRSELPRIARTWPGRTIRTFEGVHSWDMSSQGFESELNYVIRAPEGIYPVGVTTLGTDDPDTGAREWQVLFGKTGVRGAGRQLTTLGKLIVDLQYQSFNFLRQWHVDFIAAGPEAAAKLIRIDGVAPPEAKRMEIAEALMRPEAIALYPGSPTRPLGNATVLIQDDGVFVSHVIEVTATGVGADMNSLIILKVHGDKLTKEMQRLAGPEWEKEPVNTSPEPELGRYEFRFEPIELNLRPTAQRVGPKTLGVQTITSPPPGGGVPK